jgi:hypothetical protein
MTTWQSIENPNRIEQEERQPARHAVVRGEAEQRLAVAFLKDQHEDAVGGPDREQVEDDRLDRDHDRAEGDQEQQGREPEHEGEDQVSSRPRLAHAERWPGQARRQSVRARDRASLQ